MGSKRSIFFDLDGTLTDPYDGIRRCIEYALTELASDWPADEDFRWCIGPPLKQSFEQLVGPANADEALRLYRERFSETGWRENTPYEGIHDVLSELRRDGHSLFVATSKPTIYASRILQHFELANYFSGLYGPDLEGNLADKRDLLAHVLETEKALVDPVMIGDRHYDITGARHNGLATIGVLYGYGSRDELSAAGAEQLVESPSQIRTAIR